MTDFWYMLIGALIGALIGGAISFAVTVHYARQGSQELRREAEDVKHYVNALISYLEAAGEIRVVRDENGRPIETTILRPSTLHVKANLLPITEEVREKEEDRE